LRYKYFILFYKFVFYLMNEGCVFTPPCKHKSFRGKIGEMFPSFVQKKNTNFPYKKYIFHALLNHVCLKNIYYIIS